MDPKSRRFAAKRTTSLKLARHGDRLFVNAYAPVAQLDRAFDFESKGRRFEPYRVYHYSPNFFIYSWIPESVSSAFVWSTELTNSLM